MDCWDENFSRIVKTAFYLSSETICGEKLLLLRSFTSFELLSICFRLLSQHLSEMFTGAAKDLEDSFFEKAPNFYSILNLQRKNSGDWKVFLTGSSQLTSTFPEFYYDKRLLSSRWFNTFINFLSLSEKALFFWYEFSARFVKTALYVSRLTHWGTIVFVREDSCDCKMFSVFYWVNSLIRG